MSERELPSRVLTEQQNSQPTRNPHPQIQSSKSVPSLNNVDTIILMEIKLIIPIIGIYLFYLFIKGLVAASGRWPVLYISFMFGFSNILSRDFPLASRFLFSNLGSFTATILSRALLMKRT
uniref:Uncharacterized protein n=1 Tax=Cacopsylla melanoneura TaxID=428564 RepID=A0A8D8ZIF6_9HEMI